MELKKKAGAYDAYVMNLSYVELKALEQGLLTANEHSGDPDPDPVRDAMLQGMRWYTERLPLPGEEEETAEDKEEQDEELPLPDTDFSEDDEKPGAPDSPDESPARLPEYSDENEPGFEPERPEAWESLELPDPNSHVFEDDMPDMRRISKNNTSVTGDRRDLNVRLHNTDVVKLDGDAVTLDTGGWNTPTTATRMNQTSNEYDLGFRVYRKQGRMYVNTGSRDLPFAENGTIKFRLHGGLVDSGKADVKPRVHGWTQPRIERITRKPGNDEFYDALPDPRA